MTSYGKENTVKYPKNSLCEGRPDSKKYIITHMQSVW